MNITIENKKQKAIELMNKLDIYKPYIKGFKDKNSVCFYENFGGFWAYQEPELMAKIKELEEKHNVLVYAGRRFLLGVRHNRYSFVRWRH